MAKTFAASQRLRTGKVGGETYYTKNGETIVRESANATSASKGTYNQMKVRTRIKNQVTMYRAFKGNLKNCFNHKSSNQSDYTCFISTNMQSSNAVYLTKQQSASNACVAAPYKISDGPLRSIKVRGAGVDSYTNILLGDLQIDESTTIGALSTAIRTNNPDFDYEDELCYFSVLQDINDFNKIPYVIVNPHRLVLDPDDMRLVWDTLSECGFSSKEVNGKNYLAHGRSIGTGVFAWVHARGTGDEKKVSTQFLINNNEDMLKDFTSQEAFWMAAKSYGYKDTPFVYGDETTTDGQSQKNLSVLIASLRIADAATAAIALGAVGSQPSFALSKLKAVDMENGNTIAFEVKGTNLVETHLIQIRLHNGVVFDFNLDDESVVYVHTEEKIVVYTTTDAEKSCISEVVIDDTAVWTGVSDGSGDTPTPTDKFRLTVQSEDLNKGTVTGGGMFEEGDNPTFSATAKTGYEFEGWYRDGEKFSSEATCTDFDMPAANVTVIAKFSVVASEHTISLTAGNNGKVKIADGEPAQTATGTVADGGSVMITAVPNADFVFQKWSDNNMQNPRTLSNVTQDITLTATFESEE